MEKIFSEILSMSLDSVWLIVAVIVVRAIMQKSPMYFRKILWGLVGLRLVIPFSFKSSLSLVPDGVPRTTDRVAGQVAANAEQGFPFADAVPVLWTAVGMGLLIYGIITYIRLKFKIIDGTLVKGNIYQSDKIQSPFVCGFIKPKIYVPYGLDETTMKCVLQHERTHIKFADHIIKAISFVVLCAHWFNPLVWVSYFLLCKDIELSCDESVIKNMDSDGCKQYAKALLDLGVNKVKFTACPVAFGEVSIKKRIKSVINYKKTSRILVVASLCLCVGVSLCFMTEPEVPLKEKVQKAEKTEKVVVSEETTEPIAEETVTEKIEETESVTEEPLSEQRTEYNDVNSSVTTEVVEDDYLDNEYDYEMEVVEVQSPGIQFPVIDNSSDYELIPDQSSPTGEVPVPSIPNLFSEDVDINDSGVTPNPYHQYNKKAY